MKLYMRQEYRATRKEPFGAMLRRIYEGLSQGGVPVLYRFTFADHLVPGMVSSVARAVKKFPHLAPLVTTEPVAPRLKEKLPERTGPPAIIGDATTLEFPQLAELADGLPRSLPFRVADVRFYTDHFGKAPARVMAGTSTADALLHGHFNTGMRASDSWWVNGRDRHLGAAYVVDVPEGSRNAPLPGGALGAFLTTLGKPRTAAQFPITESEEGEKVVVKGKAEAPPELVALAARLRERMPELIAGARMPHVIESARAEHAQSPLKPALEKHFKPMGYACKGGSGIFTLRRRTAGNHVVEVNLDVGTWSRSLTGHFHVYMPDFQLRLPMPASAELHARQCDVGDAERWEKLVENMAAFTAHLDREVVPEVEKVAGPAPSWFEAPEMR
ncbi:hypothetical protein [Occallatibacter riparius]|uniref:Uncharacterized protein n=1 Tax=Occallatibacter riparius TaxID=1002689 RepID=A0A9J7BPJ7_9BACT|nr:hypothetical protein [Occallatibacter riparius]UWZ84527.1 hypothetical protein MOP44_01000 [Occallatibacter riparius]